METQTPKNSISILKDAVREQGGMVVLPLEKWQKIEMILKDAAIQGSQSLADDIAERRRDNQSVSLDSILEKYKI